MKKLILRTLAIVFSVLVAAALFTACGLTDLGEYRYRNADAYTAGSGSVSAEGITSVSVDWIAGDIVFISSGQTDGKITFTEGTNETNEDYLLYSAVIGGELTIKFQKSGTRNKNGFSKSLEIQIPSEVSLYSLDVDVVSGDVSVLPVNAREIEIETVSGSVNVFYPTFNLLQVESISGNIAVYARRAGKAELETLSGDVRIDTEAVGFSVSYDTLSGTVNNQCGAEQNGDVYSYGGEGLVVRVDTMSGDLFLNFSLPASPDV